MKNPLDFLYKLSDYQVLDYFMVDVVLEIDLRTKPYSCTSLLTIKPNTTINSRATDLKLDGEHMTLLWIKLDNTALASDEYELNNHSIIIKNVPQNQAFTLESKTLLQEQSDLFGLYETGGICIVKAETEGLRRVFFCIDRPDNLASYTTTIIAKKKQYPVLLSNGTLIKNHQLDNEDHSVTWIDSLPKPSYLFALVAGSLHYSVTEFTTKSGHKIPIEFYLPPKETAQCDFAKEVLKKAMRWDEEVFALPCTLPRHMVAGVDKYASGASEPTGLNLFNTENLLANPQIKTDLGMLRVLDVVAHEFFHYWSGNRVTIRDWFNLPFKEGLTTFRAALFFEDLFGTDLVRLLYGKNLDERAPRQSSYKAVRSLYTTAAYEKSADIFRMMMLIMGKEAFYKAISDFLKKNDGAAVTLEDAITSLSEASSIDLGSFIYWFTEAGIPELIISDNYDPANQRYTLKIKIKNRKKRPIPLVMILFDVSGEELIQETTLNIRQSKVEYHFDGIASRPIPSLLRSFSAPVYLNYQISNHDLLVLMRYDSNLYNRCEASKQLIKNLINEYCTHKHTNIPSALFDVYRHLLVTQDISPWMLAELLSLSSEEALIALGTAPDFELLTEGRHYIQTQLAQTLKEEWALLENKIFTYIANDKPMFAAFDIEDAGIRRLKSVYYSYAQFIDFEKVKKQLIQQATQQLDKNMSETIDALALLGEMGCDTERELLLNAFYEHWKDDSHAVNYWFKVQASTHSNAVVMQVSRLLSHPAFDLSNPNKVYALIGVFISNPYGFHNQSGEGYQLVNNVILQLDKINPPLAANLTSKYSSWRQYNLTRQEQLRESLIYINNQASSIDVKNAVNKIL